MLLTCGSIPAYKNANGPPPLPRSESEPPPCQRLYSSPICTTKQSKTGTGKLFFELIMILLCDSYVWQILHHTWSI
jgi:hypothetical protein